MLSFHAFYQRLPFSLRRNSSHSAQCQLPALTGASFAVVGGWVRGIREETYPPLSLTNQLNQNYFTIQALTSGDDPGQQDSYQTEWPFTIPNEMLFQMLFPLIRQPHAEWQEQWGGQGGTRLHSSWQNKTQQPILWCFLH